MRATYLLVLAGCLLVTLPLELVVGARVYRRPRRWLAAVGCVLVPFVGWDAAAVAAGWWRFSRRLTLGPAPIGHLPVEEVAFFVVVPTCAILAFEAVRTLAGRLRRR